MSRKYVRYGSSPRGAQALILAAKIGAILDHRYHVSRDDIRSVARPALRHRLILNFEGQAEGSRPTTSSTTFSNPSTSPRAWPDRIPAASTDRLSNRPESLPRTAMPRPRTSPQRGTPAPLFDGDFLKKLEYLSLVSRRVFRGQLLAQRRTMQLGGGIEFADHREYAPGDDFRYIDWNVYARHDELLLKRFQEEEDLHVFILIDCSASMSVGSPPKFDYARRVAAAALAYIALADLDRVAVVAFAGDVVADFPLTRGKARILSLLKFLEQLPAQGTLTDLKRSAQSFVHRMQGLRRGLVVVVSDLFDAERLSAGARHPPPSPLRAARRATLRPDRG